MEQEEVCEFCNGTGFVPNIVYDSTVHRYIQDGVLECKHPNPNYEEDYTGASERD